MRRDRARGAAGGPHHTHTLDVEARPKTEGRPRQQQVGEHTAPPPPPPRLRLRRACVVCTRTCFGCESAAGTYEPGGY